MSGLNFHDWWRAECDKSENYYCIELKPPFPWKNQRLPKLSPQRIMAERLIDELGLEIVSTNRGDIVTEVQKATSVTRTQTWNAVNKAIIMKST